MKEFKPRQPKKPVMIVLLAVFSFLLFIAIAGIFNRIAQGENSIAEYIPNIILAPISAFFVIRSSLLLKGKVKPTLIPWNLIFDVGGFCLLAFIIVGMVICFINGLPDRKYGQMIFAVVFCVFGFWGLYLIINIFRVHLALYLLATANGKNTEKKKAILIKLLMKAEQLRCVYDVNAGDIPYIGNDGLISIYDSKDFSNNVLSKISFNGKIPWYYIKIVNKKERLEWFQKIFDYGIKSIQYVTTMGSIELPLVNFPINITEDPVHNHSGQFIAQYCMAMQNMSRYAHMKEIERSEQECSSVLSVATAQTNTAVEMFHNSIFYVFVVSYNADADNVLNYSQKAFDFCTENGYTHNMSFDNITRRMVYSDNVTCPYLDISIDEKLFILSFTKYKDAKDYQDKTKDTLIEWEKTTDEQTKMKQIRYWNKLKGLSSCDICVMTGNEIAMYMMNTNCEFVTINLKQQLSRNTVKGYITDVFSG